MPIWWRLVRFGFWLLYQPLAFTYDAVSWVVSMGAWRAWTRAALQFVAPDEGRILELAHGTGSLQCDLQVRGYDAVGVDLSPQMGRIAVRKLLRAGARPRLARSRAQALPFADESFHAVIATFPTDFIVDPQTLAEVRRVLVSEGRLIIVPGAGFTAGGLVRRVLELAYRVTGQGSGAAVEARRAVGALVSQRLNPHGFVTDVHLVDCPRSQALVVLAIKRTGVQRDSGS